MSKTRKNTSKLVGILTVLACTWAVLAAPTPASAIDVEWSISGSLMDTDDLAEAFGGGIRVSIPINDNLDFDIAGSYYEDFKNRFEDNTDDRTGVELSFIPIDFGLTWTKDGDSGFQLGGGLTYSLLDVNDISIEGFDLPITGSVDDQFGGYLKVGYQAKGGFFGELFYRILEVDVKRVTIGGIPAADRDIQIDGFALNVGYRF